MEPKKRKRHIIITSVLWFIVVIWWWLATVPAFNLKDYHFVEWALVAFLAALYETILIGCGNWEQYGFFGMHGFLWRSRKAVVVTLWRSSQKKLKWLFRMELVAEIVLLVLWSYCFTIIGGMWYIGLILLALAAFISFAIAYWLRVEANSPRREYRRNEKDEPEVPKKKSKAMLVARVAGAIIALIIVSYLFGVQPLRTKDYYNLLRMSETEGGINDIPTGIDRIAVMDTDSAAVLGDMEIGSISAKSQFVVSDDYIQLNVGGKPLKVASLEYADLIRWANNRSNGVPGYIEVDPVVDNGKSEYIPLADEEGCMVYINSAVLWDNIRIALRVKHPTLMFKKPHLELDDERHKWIVAPVYDYTIGVYGGEDIIGAIIASPFAGKWQETYYALEDIPEWVDYVFDGELLCDQYNYYGKYRDGLINSLFIQNDCTKITADTGIDYGYLVDDRDILIYTGVTSMTKSNSDHGFLLANERTGEAKYIECPSVNEWAAMGSAEQEAREKEYTACFPSVTRLKIGGQDYLVYFGALKDDREFIKRYYVVDVNQGSIVAVGNSCNDAIGKFTDKINGEQPGTSTVSYDIQEEVDLSNYHQIEVHITEVVWPWANNDMVYIVTPQGYYKSKFREEYLWLALASETTIWVNDEGYFYYEHK